MAPAPSTDRPLIVFDAQCVLCSANAQLILHRDRRQIFQFASMQGEAGAAPMRASVVDPADPDTLIVVEGSRVLRNSDANLYIYRRLGWLWRAAGALGIIPRGLRDVLYGWVARRRYRGSGKREQCWAPEAADRHRLL